MELAAQSAGADAALLCCSLRHPNVVWVYGMVLPEVEERRDCEGSGDDSPDESERPSSMQVPDGCRKMAACTHHRD